MGNATILLVLGLGLNVGLLSHQLLSRSGDAVENTAQYYETTVARNIANAAVELALQQLKDNASWRAGFVDVPFGEESWSGTLSATLKDTSIGGQTYVNVEVTGEYNGETKTIFVLVKREVLGFIPDAIRGGVTANSDVRTLGNLLIDGREHTIDGVLIPNSGTLSISSFGSYTQSGSSDAGGTAVGTDYPPANPADPATIEESADWGSDGFPDTPDKVMGGASNGYPEGTLKSIALSGFDGSQWVTTPAALTFPLSGVTYVELPSGGEWGPVEFGGVSKGILVVHNAAGNAKIRNINTGTFKGLIIADDIEKIHTDIIGGVVSLTTSPTGNCIGNGSGQILYSSEAVKQATESAAGAESGESTVVSYWE